MCSREKSFTDLKDLGTQSHPRIEEAWGPNTLASHNPKPKQTMQLPFSLLAAMFCWVASLGKGLPFLVELGSSDMPSLSGKGIGKARKVAPIPLGSGLQALINLHQHQRAAARSHWCQPRFHEPFPLPWPSPGASALIQFHRVNH